MVVVHVLSPSFAKSKVLRQELQAVCPDVQFNDHGESFDRNAVKSFLKNAKPEVLIVGRETIDESFLSEYPSVRFIAKYGVGLDNIRENALKYSKVGLGWTPGVNKRSVSELVLAYMIGHRRNVFNTVFDMRNGRWKKDGGRLFSGSRVGIVGLGNIGQDLVHLLAPFGCEIKYFDIEPKKEFAKTNSLELVSYENLIKWSSILTFHVPSTEKTIGMFGARELGLSCAELLLINTSRGDIVDFLEVTNAVQKKLISGFAADVFPEEPFDSKTYSTCASLYFTPHIGGNAEEAVLAMGRAAIAHVKNYLDERFKS